MYCRTLTRMEDLDACYNPQSPLPIKTDVIGNIFKKEEVKLMLCTRKKKTPLQIDVQEYMFGKILYFLFFLMS